MEWRRAPLHPGCQSQRDPEGASAQRNPPSSHEMAGGNEPAIRRANLRSGCPSVPAQQETEHSKVCENPCCREHDDDDMIDQ
jgi:hypothetical protein